MQNMKQWADKRNLKSQPLHLNFNQTNSLLVSLEKLLTKNLLDKQSKKKILLILEMIWRKQIQRQTLILNLILKNAQLKTIRLTLMNLQRSKALFLTLLTLHKLELPSLIIATPLEISVPLLQKETWLR
jgi:hypothetical protein